MTDRMAAYEIRRAEPSDVNAIAQAHRDSIQSMGPSYYPEEIVGYWQEACRPPIVCDVDLGCQAGLDFQTRIRWIATNSS